LENQIQLPAARDAAAAAYVPASAGPLKPDDSLESLAASVSNLSVSASVKTYASAAAAASVRASAGARTPQHVDNIESGVRVQAPSAAQLSAAPSLPSFSASSASLPGELSSSAYPPSVQRVILACQRERAKLRTVAPFLLVKPSDWSEARVAEWTEAKVDIEARQS